MKLVYAENPSLTHEDIAKELGCNVNTVYKYAQRFSWTLARKAKQKELLERKQRGAASAAKKHGRDIEKEVETVLLYLDGLELVNRHAMVKLGALDPITEDEVELAKNSSQLWADMSAKDTAQILKWCADSYRELSAHKQLLVGKPTGRLEVTAPPIAMLPDEEEFLERMLNRIPNREEVEEVLELAENDEGRFEAAISPAVSPE
jgi:hypothetical protein